MKYSIGDAAKRMEISPTTLRYYDKRGLLPFVDRDKNGRRVFKENDFNFLQVIECMKKSGLTIEQIRTFIEMCMVGDMTFKKRYDFLDREEHHLMKQIQTLQSQLDFLRYKKWYYKTSLLAGTEKVHFTKNGDVDPNTRKQYETELANCGNLHDLIDYHESN